MSIKVLSDEDRKVVHEFGKCLKDIIKKMKLNQRSFADKMNVHFNTVNAWVKGRSQPQLTDIRKIIKVCNDNLDYSDYKELDILLKGVYGDSVSSNDEAFSKLNEKLNNTENELTAVNEKNIELDSKYKKEKRKNDILNNKIKELKDKRNKEYTGYCRTIRDKNYNNNVIRNLISELLQNGSIDTFLKEWYQSLNSRCLYGSFKDDLKTDIAKAVSDLINQHLDEIIKGLTSP